MAERLLEVRRPQVSTSRPRTASCVRSTASRSSSSAARCSGSSASPGPGKSVTAMTLMGLTRDINSTLRGRGDLQGQGPARDLGRRDAELPRRRDRDDLPGPDDVAEPGLPDRRADRRGDPHARADRQARRRRSARSSCCARSASRTRRRASTTSRTSSRAACGSAR